MNLHQIFHQKSPAAELAALRSVLSDSTTVADLQRLLPLNPSLGQITLADLCTPAEELQRPAVSRLGRRPPASQVARARPNTASPSTAKAPTHKETSDARAAQGHPDFDDEVLRALKTAGGKSVSAKAIRGLLRDDATADQVRSSLRRHVDAGAVTYTGKSSATKYTLT
jgi:hypothetical protein